jgi:hypothetical protein
VRIEPVDLDILFTGIIYTNNTASLEFGEFRAPVAIAIAFS